MVVLMSIFFVYAPSQTCAEETLAKAEAALREKEEQLSHLRLQHDVLRAELAAVKEGLSTSTERAEKLQEEGQVSSVYKTVCLKQE